MVVQRCSVQHGLILVEVKEDARSAIPQPLNKGSRRGPLVDAGLRGSQKRSSTGIFRVGTERRKYGLVIHAGGPHEALFGRINALNAKSGPFDVFILGDLFADDDSVVSGSVSVEASCYFGVGGRALPHKVVDAIDPNSGELLSNLVFLGKQGVHTLASGLRVATFGGQFDLDQFTQAEMANVKDPLSSPYITASAVADFKSSLAPPRPEEGTLKAATAPKAAPIDLLFTHEWPSQITHLSSKPPADDSIALSGVPAISEILAAAKPRYHFASKHSVFWEREPFKWDPSPDSPFTRFMSLGKFGNEQKERAFYAFNLVPGHAQTAPAGSTACPLSALQDDSEATRGSKRPFGVEEDTSPQNFIFEGGGQTTNKRARRGRGRGRGRDDGPRKMLTPAECWFCLSNPSVSKHLIASIGNEVYLALPKGQLPSVLEGTLVPGGGHVLVIPIGHYPTLQSLPADEAPGVTAEIEQYKAALRKCFEHYGASFAAFEVGRLSGKGSHAHIQICPVPKELAGRVETVFKEEGAKEGYFFEDDGDEILRREDIKENYFRVDLPDGRKIVHLIKPGKPFGLQFGREALATLLGMPDRADWKTCARSDAEEKEECQSFKRAFASFDPASQ